MCDTIPITTSQSQPEDITLFLFIYIVKWIDGVDDSDGPGDAIE